MPVTKSGKIKLPVHPNGAIDVTATAEKYRQMFDVLKAIADFWNDGDVPLSPFAHLLEDETPIAVAVIRTVKAVQS
jgi:hypothetical protein